MDPRAEVFPGIDVHDRLTRPMTIAPAGQDFHASRRDDVRAVVDAAPGRRLADTVSDHDVPMTRPAGLPTINLDLVRDHARDAGRAR
ncbi:hypothetical protein GCM10019016_099390 [Streptomyces prasinosporus]|uniref:Uncharacterized protein n=1 Tax=Streptomyces prasinosporus TaxID=68256 RepID=A0ABP6U6P2_9ACTN